jgi:hypothetical protein
VTQPGSVPVPAGYLAAAAGPGTAGTFAGWRGPAGGAGTGRTANG